MRISFLVLIGLAFGCSQQVEQQERIEIEATATGQSFNAAFLIIDGVYNSELMAPYDIFQHTIFHTEGGIQVFTVAPTRDTLTTFEGLKLIPDYGFLTDSIPDIDILIVPSAEHSMDTDLENEELITFVKNAGEQADYVMSLCDGAFLLAKAGLVDGHESTTFPTDITRYREMYPQLTVHEKVSFVHDHNLITSAGGAKSYDPALYLVHLLYGEKVAKGVGKGLVIDWDVNDYEFAIVD
ncbi:DJ-1/PfpI family protein [Marinoscillum sp.]|uniref:DJ-1/PfpI family protein n=1 Tax=Marinoscillum sp. TaxID=2024838 RepID=UPI003BAA9961